MPLNYSHKWQIPPMIITLIQTRKMYAQHIVNNSNSRHFGVLEKKCL